MKHIKWLLFLLTMAALVVALVACGGDVATQAPQAQATTGSAQEATQAEDEGDLSSVISEKDLDSYRSSMTTSVTGTKDDQVRELTTQVSTEYTRDPQAQHMSFTATTSTEELASTGTSEIYQVEGMQYTYNLGQWTSMPVTDTSGLADFQFISADRMLKGECGWKNQGKESLDGVSVQHWSLPKAAGQECFASLFYEKGEFTDAGGDLYVAIDGKYVAKMELFWEGEGLSMWGGTSEDAFIDKGRSEISYAMSDVNEPFTIEVPEEALKAPLMPEDIPYPPGAEQVSQAFGLITLMAPGTAQEVADYYAAEMPGYGWTAGEVQEFGGMFSLDFSSKGRTANFVITADPASGKTQVVITVQGK